MKAALSPLLGLLLAGCASTGGPGAGDPGDDRSAKERQNQRAAATNVQLASGYLEEGRIEVALEKIQRALSFDASLPEAHTVAGIIYERIGDAENAEVHYRQAVRLDPDSGPWLNNYGQFLCKIGRRDEGLEKLDRAIRDPFYDTPAVALTNAGACHEAAGDAEQAEAHYRRALETSKTYADALFRLSRLLHRAADDFRARAFLQRYEAVGPPFPESLRLGIAIEEALGNEQEAESYRTRLRRLFPDEASARARQGAGP